MQRSIRILALAGVLLAAGPAGADEVLTLDAAWQRVARAHPALAAAAAAVDARTAAVEQAGRGLNPELAFEAENLAGTGPYGGLDAADLTLTLAQTWERGGKADRRRAVAAARLEAGRTAADLARLALRADLARAFVGVLAARERVALADSLARLAAQDRDAVDRRVAAGAESPIASHRARLAWSAAQRDRDRARQDLVAARRGLGVLWGDEAAAYPPVAGDLHALAPVPTWDEVLARAQAGPAVRRAEADLATARAAAALANSAAVGDLTTAAGVRHFRDGGDEAFVLEVALPLPLRDRGADRKRAAAAEVVRGEAAVRAVLVDLRGDLADAWNRLATGRDDALVIRRELLPAAAAALDEARRAYTTGGYSLNDVLAVRRTWTEWQLAHVEAVATHHRAAVDLAALLGTDPLPEVRP